ncbi:MAG: hypothetical protein D6732_10390 [Methanobacteriota archaeon]|nr:MAG: hypothetical protein D6732_10390 [Euryarchaeota archaeon]
MFQGRLEVIGEIMSNQNPKIKKVIDTLAEGSRSVRNNPSEQNYREWERKIEQAGKTSWTPYIVLGVIAIVCIYAFVIFSSGAVATQGINQYSQNGQWDGDGLSSPPVATQITNRYSQPTSFPPTQFRDNSDSDNSSGGQRQTYYPLAGCAGSRLMIGDRAMVSLIGGPNAIRSTPDTHPSDNILYKAQPGEYLKIIGGPKCNYGYILWKVRVEKNGIVGWTPESKDGATFWIVIP